MMGCEMPPMLLFPVTAETSIIIFRVTSPPACTCGVMSMLTPTSRYWNWVLTSGLMPTPPMPGWNEPVATGTRSPILSEAFWPSRARIWGFWMSLVLLSLKRACTEACGMVTWKSVAFKLAKLLRLMLPLLLELFEEVLELELLEEDDDGVTLGCSVTLADVGGLMPRFRTLSRLTCMMATSTITSGLALSISLMSFSARATWSGVPRTTIAFCEGNC